jgi:hypothetical protein
MQKVYFFVFLVLGFFTAKAQLVFNENFTPYAIGPLGTQGLWQQSGSGTDVQVSLTQPLTYSSYGSGTKYIEVASVNGTDPFKSFSTDINTNPNRVIYMSFVVRVSSARKANLSPDSSITLRNTGNTNIPLRFYIAENNLDNGIQFGIQIGANTLPQYTIGNFVYNQTYLIVIRYEIANGPNSDDAYLYVNPTSFPNEPTAFPTPATGAAIINGAEGTGFPNSLNALQIIQSSDNDSPDAAYDGLKVAHGATSAEAWSNLNATQAALPVLMKSFRALKDNSLVRVLWEVDIEYNVRGYEIQRSHDGSHFEPIGFVDATAKSNYSFIDNRPLSGANFYRVITIDNDLRLKYSSIVSVNGRKDLYISCFPNPATRKLIVQHQEVSGPAYLRVISLDGRVIKQVRPPLYSVQTDIDVIGLSPGNYILEFVNGGKRVSATLIRQ